LHRSIHRVKPIHLNLASRPYRDYRPVYAAVVVMSLLTAFLMLNNIETYYRYTRETKTTRAKIADLELQAQKERDRDQAVQQQMKNLDLARLDVQTKFINAKLGERAFSWSTLLDELESILIDDVRLISVAPAFDKEGNIKLTMQFESKSADGMVTTINRMNNDPQFHDPFPTSDLVSDQGIYMFSLIADYLPPSPDATPKSSVVKTKSAEVRR
ncbi:MAG: hypothetical protein ACLGH0_03520, partial [Thermoanaerobaculia bacterium]